MVPTESSAVRITRLPDVEQDQAEVLDWPGAEARQQA